MSQVFCISALVVVFLTYEPCLELRGIAWDLGLGPIDRGPLEAEAISSQQARSATSWL